MSDRANEHAHGPHASLWKRGARSANVPSLDGLAVRLRDDMRAAKRLRRQAGRAQAERKRAQAIAAQAAAEGREVAVASRWLAPAGGAAKTPAVGAAGRAAGGKAQLDGALNLLQPRAKRAWLKKQSKASAESKASVGITDGAPHEESFSAIDAGSAAGSSEADEDRKRRLEAAASGLEAVSRAQDAARALRSLSSDLHEGDAAWVGDAKARQVSDVAS